MKTFIAVITIATFTFNANALEFAGSTKHIECATKVSNALGIQDKNHVIWLADKKLKKGLAGYFSGTDRENTSVLVINKKLSSGRHEAKLTIAHEMVHVMQYIRGDHFNLKPKYNKRKHEKEAFKLEKSLYRLCN
tara:strand:- start:163 stop:567 length:405 start_codon:yes stop_codon:yes gene_type:complete